MDYWYPIVIGTVAFCYVHLFNWNVKTFGGSGDRTRAL